MATEQREKRGERLKSVVVDGSILLGGGLLTYGAWLAWAPAGFLVPGALLLAAGLRGART